MLEFELSYERALTDHGQRLGRLEMLIGRDLPREAARQGDKASKVKGKAGGN